MDKLGLIVKLGQSVFLKYAAPQDGTVISCDPVRAATAKVVKVTRAARVARARAKVAKAVWAKIAKAVKVGM